LILKDLTSQWVLANSGQRNVIQDGAACDVAWGFLHRDRGERRVRGGGSAADLGGKQLTTKKQDAGLKAAGTNSQEEKKIAGIALRDI
jgi:hypothetical protein